ncbi:MAG: hypothetical protein KDE55_06315 [Novosphingobium sp.]|nr:hypothetical protein [Novosphingobium sp.]
MTEEPKATELTDGDLDQVTGAGGEIPFPDIGSGGGKEFKGSGNVKSSLSSGNEAGTDKGMISSSTSEPAKVVTGGLDEKVDGIPGTTSGPAPNNRST